MLNTSVHLRKVLPKATLRWLRGWQGRLNRRFNPPGGIHFGDLRRLTPISRSFGFDRGTPIDRYYIERFVASHSADIRGRVLEVGENSYTRRFGGDRVSQSDVLHAVEGNPQATIVGDLSGSPAIASEAFDCIICTQTLFTIYRVGAAMRTLYRVLKPGGVLLLSVPGVAHQISRYDMERWGDNWRFTSLSMRRLVEEVFPPSLVQLQTEGNVLAAVAFLHGIAVEELRTDELDYRDPDYQVSILVRAMRPES